jgi:hypothetical protein
MTLILITGWAIDMVHQRWLISKRVIYDEFEFGPCRWLYAIRNDLSVDEFASWHHFGFFHTYSKWYFKKFILVYIITKKWRTCKYLRVCPFPLVLYILPPFRGLQNPSPFVPHVACYYSLNNFSLQYVWIYTTVSVDLANRTNNSISTLQRRDVRAAAQW